MAASRSGIKSEGPGASANDHEEDDADLFVLHSLPHPDEIPREKVKKGNKTMQTIAGVAGNVLEWYVLCYLCYTTVLYFFFSHEKHFKMGVFFV